MMMFCYHHRELLVHQCSDDEYDRCVGATIACDTEGVGLWVCTIPRCRVKIFLD